MSPAYARAQVAYGLNRFRDAIREVQEALADNPNHADAHVLLGQSYCALGQYAAALTEIQTALGLNPELGHAHYAQAWVHKEQGKWGPAREAVDEALRLESDNAAFYACLAEIESHANRYAQSLDASSRGLEVAPQHVDCLIWRAEASRCFGKLDQAEAAVRQALSAAPESAKAHALLGKILLDRERDAEALDCYREALRLNASDEAALNGFLQCLSRMPGVIRWMRRQLAWWDPARIHRYWVAVVLIFASVVPLMLGSWAGMTLAVLGFLLFFVADLDSSPFPGWLLFHPEGRSWLWQEFAGCMWLGVGAMVWMAGVAALMCLGLGDAVEAWTLLWGFFPTALLLARSSPRSPWVIAAALVQLACVAVSVAVWSVCVAVWSAGPTPGMRTLLVAYWVYFCVFMALLFANLAQDRAHVVRPAPASP